MNNKSWRSILPRQKLPILIICRDLVSDLTSLVNWFEKTGHENIILLDNKSTYPPLLEYFSASPHEVIKLKSNFGHRSPWLSGFVERFDQATPFVVTDPDLLPDPDAPADSFEYFQELLLRYNDFDKVGFGLHIDDLPEINPYRDQVIQWETPFWSKELEPLVFAAHLDTTLALHRPNTAYKVTEAIRTGLPYMAKHLPWYRDPFNANEETSYYLKNRDNLIGYWNRQSLHPEVAKRFNNRDKKE